MLKKYEQVSIRLWPARALSIEQEDQILTQWESLLDAREVAHAEVHLHTQLTDDEASEFTESDLVDLVTTALRVDHLVMLDVYALETKTQIELAFRVHLDHLPVRQLCELHRRRVLDPQQTLMCLHRLNLAEKTFAMTAQPVPV